MQNRQENDMNLSQHRDVWGLGAKDFRPGW